MYCKKAKIWWGRSFFVPPVANLIKTLRSFSTIFQNVKLWNLLIQFYPRFTERQVTTTKYSLVRSLWLQVAILKTQKIKSRIAFTAFPSFTNKGWWQSYYHCGAAIAQWIRLHLPSCCPGFESQAHYLCFYSQILYYIVIVLRKGPK